LRGKYAWESIGWPGRTQADAVVGFCRRDGLADLLHHNVIDPALAWATLLYAKENDHRVRRDIQYR
jgi:hypothetical protein